MRRGLLVPGFQSGVRVVNGSAYGVGIYLATEASTSLGYVREGNKMLVCAVLPAREKVVISQSRHRNFSRQYMEIFLLRKTLDVFSRCTWRNLKGT